MDAEFLRDQIAMTGRQRDAAIAERDAARFEAHQMRKERDDARRVYDTWMDERDEARAEADKLREQLGDREQDLAFEYKRANEAEAELYAARAELRAALVSVIDGWSEFDLEHNTGMDVDEARRVMDLAYNRQ